MVNKEKTKKDVIDRLEKIRGNIKFPNKRQLTYIGRRLNQKDTKELNDLLGTIAWHEAKLGTFIKSLKQKDTDKLIRDKFLP